MRQVRGPETGGALPRGAHQGNLSHVAFAAAVLVVCSPVAFIVASVTVIALMRQLRRHWWEWALAAGIAAVVIGVIMQLATGDVAAAHFGGYPAALAATRPHGHWLTAWLLAWVRTIPLGVPVGLAAGASYIGLSERWAGGAEWHPIEQHRRSVEQTKTENKVTALLKPEAALRCSAPPLGASRGGDLTAWTEKGYVVVPTGQFPAMGLLGESGSGKTVTAERLVTLWARAGRKVIFADFKGSDPTLAPRILAAYKKERPDAIAAWWPTMPLDMWRGSPDEIINRLLQVQDFSEPYYKSVAETAVRLAVQAPDVEGYGPVCDSASFLRRLNADFLKRAYERTSKIPAVQSVTRNPERLDGVMLRYDGFFSALGPRLDHGWSFEDVDVAVISVPTLAQRSDAMAVAKMILLDFGAYCMARKPRLGEDVTFIVDEFSAVTEAAPMVIDIAERVRDVGGQVVISAQNYEGLGQDEAERRRMRDALAPGGLIVHRLADPDEVIKVAGTVRAMEPTTQIDQTGHTGMGSVKMAHKMKVDPDEVRQLPTGQAFVMTHGRAVRMSVLCTRIPTDVAEHARWYAEQARWQATADLREGRPPQPQDWWEVRLDSGPQRLQLEAGSIGELLGGGDTPPELPKGPGPINPRIMLAVAAYVRAGLMVQARQIAAAHGISEPARYVARIAAERDAALGTGRRRRPVAPRREQHGWSEVS